MTRTWFIDPRPGIVLRRDLTGMAPAAIHDHLADQGLLPARGRAA